MLQGEADVPAFYVTLKFIATWLSAWVGIPGGIFAPSLSIGAGVGHNVSMLMGGDVAPALIAMGMAAFLAAVTQAPLTAFIIVMEMVDGHAMVLSLMSAAMLASLVSRMLARPLYETLAHYMVISAAPAPPSSEPDPSSSSTATPPTVSPATPQDNDTPPSRASAV
jgi:H+/Cl- antiporter ClcA